MAGRLAEIPDQTPVTLSPADGGDGRTDNTNHHSFAILIQHLESTLISHIFLLIILTIILSQS